jgi:hypothetical protein
MAQAFKRPKYTTKASKIKRQPVRWLWREHIPEGKLVVVAGRPEKGKSLLTTLVTAEVSQNFAVIMSSHEDDADDTLVPRLEVAGADMDNVHIWKKGVSLPRDLRALRSEVDRVGAALVVMDPIASHTRASIYNTTAIREALGPLRDMADDTNVSFLFVHHIIKNVDMKGDPQNAIGGAGGGIGAMVRCAYLFGESPDDIDERLMVQLKCNIAPHRPGLRFELDVEDLDDETDAAFLTYLGNTTATPHKVFQAQPGLLNDEKLEAIAEWLVAQLREGPMKIEAIMDAAIDSGLTKRSVKRVAALLEVETVKKKWRLNKEFPGV